MVYMTTPTGRRKQAAAVGTPVRDVTTAEPPVSNIAVTFEDPLDSKQQLNQRGLRRHTKILVMRPKTVNTKCP
jgi:hypothetical protein